jgi:ferritin
MCTIFNFIKEHDIDIEGITIDDPPVKWVSPHDFRGSIIINTDDKTFKNEIYSSQKFETNLYAVLNFLNDHIEDKEYFMPIKGINTAGQALHPPP